MKPPILIVGIGELGGEFARGFLRCGYPVYPITRKMNMADMSLQIPSPALTLITVPEHELHSTLNDIPKVWQDTIALLQNELLPCDWQRHDLVSPTVAVIWFEKKPEIILTNVLDTPVYGLHAHLLIEALDALKVPNRLLKNSDDLLYELVRKSLYIQTVNICGLQSNCTVGDLWYKHQSLAEEVAGEIIDIQEWMIGAKLSKGKLIAGMVEGIEDCPDRFCLGRSAASRLKRALAFAQEAEIETPKLREISHYIHQEEIKGK